MCPKLQYCLILDFMAKIKKQQNLPFLYVLILYLRLMNLFSFLINDYRTVEDQIIDSPETSFFLSFFVSCQKDTLCKIIFKKYSFICIKRAKEVNPQKLKRHNKLKDTYHFPFRFSIIIDRECFILNCYYQYITKQRDLQLFL